MTHLQDVKTQIILGGTQIHYGALPVAGSPQLLSSGNDKINIAFIAGTSKDPFKDLVDRTASTALYNSATIAELGQCHPSTRRAILQRLEAHINTDNAHPFVWLYGSAGSGKSAIMRTLCESLDKKDQLLASFFFRSSATQCLSERFVPTLVAQFCRAIPGLRSLVADSINHDPFIFSQSLESQLHSLLIQPLLMLHAREELPVWERRAVVVDGLDECRSEGRRKQLLQLLRLLTDSVPLTIAVVLASRPHYDIRRELEAPEIQSKVLQEALNLEPDIDADIRVFLEDEFHRIRTTHPLHQYLPLTNGLWPSTAVLNLLVEKASGQFIFATIVIWFIQPDRSDPEERLQIILGALPPGKLQPFQALDILYLAILDFNVEDQDVASVSHILGIALTPYATHSFPFTFNPYLEGKVDPHFIDRALAHTPGSCRRLLLGFESVLTVGRDDEPIQFFHKSFHDFLLDEERSGRYHFTPRSIHQHLLQCFVAHDFWFQDGRIHEFEMNNFRSLLQSIQDLSSESCVWDINFVESEARVNQRAELTSGPVWIDLCGSFLEALLQAGADKCPHYPPLYQTFVSVVRRRVQDVYFAHPETLLALYRIIRPAHPSPSPHPPPESRHDDVEYMNRISPEVLGLEGDKGFCIFTPYRRLGRNHHSGKKDPLRSAVREVLGARGPDGKFDSCSAMQELVTWLSTQDPSVIRTLSDNKMLVTMLLAGEAVSARLARTLKGFVTKFSKQLTLEDRDIIREYMDRVGPLEAQSNSTIVLRAKSAAPRVALIRLLPRVFKR